MNNSRGYKTAIIRPGLRAQAQFELSTNSHLLNVYSSRADKEKSTGGEALITGADQSLLRKQSPPRWRSTKVLVAIRLLRYFAAYKDVFLVFI
jgi:hypothetical protein